MPYAGGKQAIAERIAALFPAHDHYVELFGGALSVLLAKPRSKIETVNDINGDLMTFWRVLRQRPDDLERVCALTPHGRGEYLAARDLEVDDDLERARRVWVQLTQGRGSRLGVKTGWRFVHGTNGMALARYLDGYLQRIAPAAERLHGVTLECRDALDVLRTFERRGALVYADPPYVLDTRHGRQYANEYTDERHEQLLVALTRSPAAVVLSGYDCELYRDHLTGWHVATFPAVAVTGARRTEVVWTNFAREDLLPLEAA